jgi:hypothetical protein
MMCQYTKFGTNANYIHQCYTHPASRAQTRTKIPNLLPHFPHLCNSELYSSSRTTRHALQHTRRKLHIHGCLIQEFSLELPVFSECWTTVSHATDAVKHSKERTDSCLSSFPARVLVLLLATALLRDVALRRPPNNTISHHPCERSCLSRILQHPIILRQIAGFRCISRILCLPRPQSQNKRATE